MVNYVEQYPRWDQIEELYQRKEALLQDNSDAIVDNLKIESNLNSNYEQVRVITREPQFLIIEYLTHVRYLIDFIFMEEEEIKFYKFFMGLKTDNYHKYLFDVCLGNYKHIKALDFSKLDEDIYFSGFNIMTIEKIFIDLNRDFFQGRNKAETQIANIYEINRGKFSEAVQMRLQYKKEIDGNILNTTNLVKNWVNRMASLEELQHTTNDVKLLTGMRFDKTIEIDSLKNYLNSKMIEFADLGEQKERELDQIKFIVYVIGFEEILMIIQSLLHSHIDLANYLEHLFDFRISYKMACSISMTELISEDNNTFSGNGKTTNKDIDEEQKIFNKNRDILIKKFSGDKILKEKFEKLKSSWQLIMKYREKYADSFDFRFLCHAEEMPEEKINKILGEESQLIYFLPNEKYVESLFMSASLQTLAKIQNKIIDDHPHQFFKANYTRPKKTGVQYASKLDICSLSRSLVEVINKCSYANLNFNKDGELVYNLDMVERELSIDLFFGRKKLMFEEQYIRNFNFSMEFSEVNNNVQIVAMKFGQTFMDAPDNKYVHQAIEKSAQETLVIFARKLKDLAQKKFDLNLICGLGNALDLFIIKFDSYKDQDISDVEDLAQEITMLLNKANITLNNVLYVYELIEKALFESGLQHLDATQDLELTKVQTEGLLKVLDELNDPEKEKVMRVAKGMILRLLLGSTNDNIGQSDMVTGMQYSDVLPEDQFINDGFFEGVSQIPGLVLSHLPGLVRLLN